jgi:hypothetical protein
MQEAIARLKQQFEEQLNKSMELKDDYSKAMAIGALFA